MSDQPNQSVSSSVRTSEPVSVLGNSPGVEARWAEWIERGRQHDIAGRRTLRLVLLGVAIVGALATWAVGMGGAQ